MKKNECSRVNIDLEYLGGCLAINTSWDIGLGGKDLGVGRGKALFLCLLFVKFLHT